MTTPELLQKVFRFFQEKTNSKISNELLEILPTSGPVIDQLKEIGLMSTSGELLHIGESVEALENNGSIIDLFVAGKSLTGNEPEVPLNDLTPLTSDSFVLTILNRTYKLLGIEKSNKKLKVTIRLELGDKLFIDTVNLYQSSNKNRAVQEICQTFHLPVGDIKGDLKQLIEAIENYSYIQSQPAVTAMTEKDKQEAISLGKSKDFFKLILQDYEKLGSIGEENNKLLCYLTGVSRLFEKPLSIMVISSSGAGKSELVTKTLDLLPPETVIQLTSLSAKALFYKDEDSLKGKILSLEEDAGGDTASYAIRQLISSSSLTVETTVRDQLDGKIKTQHNKVNCQTAVFITSTNPDTDQETKSRFFILHVDESKEQTERIVNLQKHSRSLNALESVVNKDKIINKHRNLQRLLKPYHIVNPYVDQLTLADSRLSARRNFPKYLTLIDSVCLLRQFQKKIKTYDDLEYLEVDKTDLKLADKLFKYVVANSSEELNGHSRELLQVLMESFTGSFTRQQIRDFTLWSLAKVQRCMTELLKHELVILESGGRGKVHQYKLIQTYSENLD
jgi:hypothetical protein